MHARGGRVITLASGLVLAVVLATSATSEAKPPPRTAPPGGKNSAGTTLCEVQQAVAESRGAVVARWAGHSAGFAGPRRNVRHDHFDIQPAVSLQGPTPGDPLRGDPTQSQRGASGLFRRR